jgi:hypothetical protein
MSCLSFFVSFFLRNARKTSFLQHSQSLYCTAGTGSKPRKIIFADFAHVHVCKTLLRPAPRSKETLVCRVNKKDGD